MYSVSDAKTIYTIFFISPTFFTLDHSYIHCMLYDIVIKRIKI